ncbi:MAG: hypothetical protein A4E20_11875 [Nitrospira sp. SG-bin2]|uniref:hypothetical protein n=1 Tax=Nitrospira cf. moscoviensis SBR1015 TaxID=96242 RepID=UPI000A0B316F|nr:hypothetical protein [Nitrospira cf. moscoviensis SBR1015]OQW34126.1 MAG: hypothetical protein A4E20_11875 [Nitrospira sp. SG-bin2]
MNWLALITGVIKLVSALADYLREKKLMDAGEAQAIVAGNAETLKRLEDARKGRDAMQAGDGDSAEWAERVRRKYQRD